MILSNKEHWRFRGRDLIGARFQGRDVWPKSVTPELVRLTPAMTSNTTPAPFVITSNTSYPSQDGRPYYAFDQKQATIFHSGEGQTTSLWLAIDIGSVRNIRTVKIYSRPHPSYQNDTPSMVTLSSSGDGLSWNEERKVENIPLPVGQNIVFVDEDVNFKARHLRFDFSNTRPASRGYTVISEIEIIGF